MNCFNCRTCSVVVVLTAVLVIGARGKAAVAGESTDKTLSPYFYVEGAEGATEDFPLKSTDVTADISGVIARVEIRQTYANKGNAPIHARYIFPASTRAAVNGLRMKVGEKVIEARIKPKETAKREFAQARREGKRASLLSQQRPNVFSMNVANILPGDTVELVLTYTEMLVPEEGVYQFMYPAVVGPRYSNHPEETAPESDQWVKNPYLRPETANPSNFDITVNLSTGMPVQDITCSSHETRIDYKSTHTAQVRLNSAEDGGNRDYILNYRLAGAGIETGLLLYEGEEENFFLLMAQPPERVTPEIIPPREYIFVVDISGSMNGFPLNTAKNLLRDLIGGLKPTDMFNVVLFAGGSRLMSPASVTATTAHVQEAIRMIDEQSGGGGTELLKALEKALALPSDTETSRSVIVVTDGYINAEKDVFKLIADHAGDINAFTFGIGSSVNRYLIEGLARSGHGEAFVVTRPEESRKTAERFREYVSTPLLTRIRLETEGFDVCDLEPGQIPDLFAARPVVVVGKWRGTRTGKLTLSGWTGQGGFSRTFDVAGASLSEKHAPLRYLWARQRIARLSDFNTSGTDNDIKEAVTNLGLTYNLLTRYTSFIAVEETVVNPGGSGRDVKQPLPLPKGVSASAVGCRNVPEPELSWILAAMIAMLILAELRRRAKQNTRR